MTFNEVRAAIGEPNKVEVHDVSYLGYRETIWNYLENGSVEFRNERVSGWKEQ